MAARPPDAFTPRTEPRGSASGPSRGSSCTTRPTADIEITDGEAYYVGPGHTPEIFPNTEIVEFSPTAELNATMEVVTKNLQG